MQWGRCLAPQPTPARTGQPGAKAQKADGVAYAQEKGVVKKADGPQAKTSKGPES